MNGGGEFLIGVVMAIGLVGVLLPVLPGLILIAGAGVVWALEVGTWQAWGVVVVMIALLAAGTVIKYRIPGRELAETQASSRTWILAGVMAVIGFFVVPIVGLVLGFVVGIYLGERLDRGTHGAAWASTRRLLAGIGKGIAFEFAAGASAVFVWAIAAVTM